MADTRYLARYNKSLMGALPKTCRGTAWTDHTLRGQRRGGGGEMYMAYIRLV
jgi:hypothetical protein